MTDNQKGNENDRIRNVGIHWRLKIYFIFGHLCLHYFHIWYLYFCWIIFHYCGTSMRMLLPAHIGWNCICSSSIFKGHPHSAIRRMSLLLKKSWIQLWSDLFQTHLNIVPGIHHLLLARLPPSPDWLRSCLSRAHSWKRSPFFLLKSTWVQLFQNNPLSSFHLKAITVLRKMDLFIHVSFIWIHIPISFSSFHILIGGVKHFGNTWWNIMHCSYGRLKMNQSKLFSIYHCYILIVWNIMHGWYGWPPSSHHCFDVQ